MSSVEQLQTKTHEQIDTAVNSVHDLTKQAQTIATAHKDYAKQSFEHGIGYFEKLAGLKSVDQLIDLNKTHAKAACELFVNESTRIGVLYRDFAKEAFKPFGGVVGSSVTPSAP